MPDPPPPRLVLYALAALVLVALAAWYLGRDRDRGAPATGAAPPAAIRVEGEDGGGAELTVHVAGEVRQPGVYRLEAGSRVDDAVQRAGGPRRRADLSGLNLAAELEDGRQVLVPRRAPAVAAAGGTAAAPGSAPVAPSVPLNLNTATPEQLDELDGIGPATAQQIVQFREAHGGFGSVEELAQVPGIGDKRLATLREQVRV